MINLQNLRENPNFFKTEIAKKKFNFDLDLFLIVDENRRKKITEIDHERSKKNIINNAISILDKKSVEYFKKIQETKLISKKIKELESSIKIINEEWNILIQQIPNLPHNSVIFGKKSTENKVIGTWGNLKKISKYSIPHYEITWFQRYINFEKGVKVTSSGFPFYIGDMARLVRALISFFLNESYKKNYIELSPPILVNEKSAFATGQLPDKENQMYKDEQDNLYLLPTSEISIVNFFKKEIFQENDLPLKYCSYTPCFRREAGSWGKEVRGLNRLHQFDKVELVQFTHPEKSFQALEELLKDAKNLLELLEIPYRIVSICTGDLGFPHSKQYDLEVWANGQKRWLEVSSCSNFTDFQARRAEIKFKVNNKNEFLHTLNASGLAVPRVLAAILENNLQKDNQVKIPLVLKSWFDKDYIGEKI